MKCYWVIHLSVLNCVVAYKKGTLVLHAHKYLLFNNKHLQTSPCAAELQNTTKIFVKYKNIQTSIGENSISSQVLPLSHVTSLQFTAIIHSIPHPVVIICICQNSRCCMLQYHWKRFCSCLEKQLHPIQVPVHTEEFRLSAVTQLRAEHYLFWYTISDWS